MWTTGSVIFLFSLSHSFSLRKTHFCRLCQFFRAFSPSSLTRCVSRGHRFAVGQRKKVVDIHTGIFSFGLPFCSVVLEGAKQFFFLAIHRNDRITLLLKLLTLAVDVLKLSISIEMRGPFDGFFVGS